MAPPVVAFCPCPPVLVPELAQGAAAELDGLRAACDRAVLALLAAAGGPVTVLAPGPFAQVHPAGSAGTLAGLGVPAAVGGPGAAVLSLGSTLGSWLLARAGAGAAAFVETGPDGDPGDEGARVLAASPGLLVMGDGTACLGARAPGGDHPGAPAYDDRIAEVLASGDATRLAGLDAAEAAAFLAAGVPAWVAAGTTLDRDRPTGGWLAELVDRRAPYGVSYLVATWLPRGPR